MTDVTVFLLSAVSFGIGAYKAFVTGRQDIGFALVGACLLMIGVWVG